MSANDEDVEIPNREIAYRLFAAEYDDASVSYTESDEERAPNYVVSPTGARINRLFAVGTLTEVTAVNDEMVRARVVDPTGAFVVYAGQYQPDELAALESIDPPAFVAVTGKARTFEPDDGDEVYTSIRPESVAVVDADTRDRWVVSAAEQTLERIGTYAVASAVDASGDALTEALREAGVEPGVAAGVPLARDRYGTTPSYLASLRDRAIEAVEVVAGDRDQVGPLEASPDDRGREDATLASLTELTGLEASDLESAAEVEAVEASADADEPVDAEAVAESTPEPESVATASAAGTATPSESNDSEATAVDAEPGEAAVTAAESPDTADAAASETEPTADDSLDATADASASGTDSVDAGTEPDGVEDSSLEADADPEADAASIDDAGMYEMDEEEREQLEEEFGAEFTTGAEVEEPGEAGIDVPEPDSDSDAEAESEGEAAKASESDPSDDLGAAPTSGLADEDEDADEDADGDADEDEVESDADEEATTEPDEEAPDTTETEPAASDESEAAEDEAAEGADGSEEIDPAEIDLEEYVVETMGELDDGDGADRDELVDTVAADVGVDEDAVEDAIQDALMGGQCYEPDDETLKPI
ncbi:hypothetical protein CHINAEXTREME_19435 [Halobiforma lacisalsi AJ5]|uniref:Rpa-associated protein n=1 Tax=Natronobacterium lacisalsi AJ5 TaxID=358396 RepID=M0LVB2_NATLA|nr:hypothetical protein [Halobiforma lacisalsi]APW99810.1 hypothetical protein CHINAEXTREME_19435 [Halobiforma lacisalsi AJ5]EMA36010.1 hypothetical protein C445_04113 [Halobiforma lacisalsi AJ5]